MSHQNPLRNSRYEIVKYNKKTRQDIEVLPGQIEGLREVNRKIETLNASVQADSNQHGEIIYYRRRVGSK